MRPVVCMITERGRLAAAPTADADAVIDAVARRVALAARFGVHLVQVRERDLEGDHLLRVVRACLDAVRTTGARILVNERFDVALAAGAHGVHLRAASMPAPRLRAHAPSGFLVGRSVHTLEEAMAAEAGGGVDYLQFGPVFPTRSKPGAGGTGTSVLADVVRNVRLPVLAVGGVTSATAHLVAGAGAAGFAAIDIFSGAGGLRELAEACAAFDSSESRSLT